mgnify:FL=1
MTQSSLSHCRACEDSRNLTILIDFGQQPRSFDYCQNTAVDIFKLTLGQCESCGVVQLFDVVPSEYMKPTHQWVNNKEPDGHLTKIADILLKEGMKKQIKVLFVSRFDTKVYEIVSGKAGIESCMIDAKKDLGIESDMPGQALIQEKLDYEKLKLISRELGEFDFVVCCRLLEHTYKLSILIKGMSLLLNDNGKLIVEVPDSRKPLEQVDVAMLWEEHISYFTKETLVSCMKSNGFSCLKTMTCKYPQENALIGVFDKANEAEMELSNQYYSKLMADEVGITRSYADSVNNIKELVTNYLYDIRKISGDIILFGAGHRGVCFLNLMGITNKIVKYVIDDDPNKSNLRVPGCGIMIKGASSISYDGIGVCIFAVDISVEEKIANKINRLAGKKIEFYSISPESSYALPILTDKL